MVVLEIEELGVVGANFLDLATGLDRWITRRVERLELLDDQIGRRDVTVDIDIARELALHEQGLWPLYQGYLVVPVAVFSRASHHVTIDVVGEDGARLGRLNRKEERDLAFHGFVSFAEDRLQVAFTEDTRNALSELIVKGIGFPERSLAEQGDERRIRDDAVLLRLLEELTANYFLVTLIRPDSRPRRTVRFGYIGPVEEYAHINRGDRRASRPSALRVVGQRAAETVRSLWQTPGQRELAFTVHGARDCQSYHAVIHPPAELRLIGTTLFADEEKGNGAVTTTPYPDADERSIEGHVWVELARASRNIRLQSRLHLLPSGLVRNAVVSIALTCVVLVTGLLYLVFGDQSFNRFDTNSATALLLLVPAAIGTLIARPTSNSIISSMYFGTRSVVTVASGTSYVAAVLVATKGSGKWLVVVWSVLVALSLVCLVLAARQVVSIWQLSRRVPTTADEAALEE